MLMDWPRQLGKELGMVVAGPHTNRKSFEFMIEWNACAKFSFPICFFMLINVLEFHFIQALFIWSYSLDPSLVVCFLCRWSQGDLEDVIVAPSTSTRTRISLSYQVHHIAPFSFILDQMDMLSWIDHS